MSFNNQLTAQNFLELVRVSKNLLSCKNKKTSTSGHSVATLQLLETERKISTAASEKRWLGEEWHLPTAKFASTIKAEKNIERK